MHRLALTTRLLVIDQFIRRESALEGRVRDLHAELESVRREVTVATRERDFAREESARTREAMDELETKVRSFLLSFIYLAIKMMMSCFFYRSRPETAPGN